MKPTVLHFDQDLLIFITEPDASVSESGVNSNRSSRIASPCINRPRNSVNHILWILYSVSRLQPLKTLLCLQRIGPLQVAYQWLKRPEITIDRFYDGNSCPS